MLKIPEDFKLFEDFDNFPMITLKVWAPNFYSYVVKFSSGLKNFFYFNNYFNKTEVTLWQNEFT